VQTKPRPGPFPGAEITFAPLAEQHSDQHADGAALELQNAPKFVVEKNWPKPAVKYALFPSAEHAIERQESFGSVFDIQDWPKSGDVNKELTVSAKI
jgi:hypothetical protein